MWGASSLRDTMAPDRDRAPRGFWCLLCSFTKYCRTPASKSSTKYLCRETTVHHFSPPAHSSRQKKASNPSVDIQAPNPGSWKPKVSPRHPQKSAPELGESTWFLSQNGACNGHGRQGTGPLRIWGDAHHFAWCPWIPQSTSEWPENSRGIGRQVVNMLHMTSQEQLEFTKPLREAVSHATSSKLGLELPSAAWVQ